jgi:hypothetical protein
MFCPTCGAEERQPIQYCRSCGTDLRVVRAGLQNPETANYGTDPREHITRALADKIRETQSASELKKVAEDVLPKIEKFFETPDERRLRRIRLGVIFASMGVGGGLIFNVLSYIEKDFIFFVGVGGVFLFLGLAIILNGLLFTKPRKGREPDAQKNLDPPPPRSLNVSSPPTNELDFSGRSVTEHTTHHLNVER